MTTMEIRKNNDIKFRIHLTNSEENPLTNIKDVKCTIVNSGISAFCWNMHFAHDKMFHSVMCGYDHTYNVFPVNSSAYWMPFVEDKHKQLGIQRLLVRFYPATAIAEAYFPAELQKATGDYNLTIELQCWDPEWADKGFHTHTVQLNKVITLTSNDTSVTSPNVIDLNVTIPHNTSSQS